MWHASQLSSERAQLLTALNPLAVWLDLMRQPLLGAAPPTSTWLASGLVLGLLLVVCSFTYLIARRRINYWL